MSHPLPDTHDQPGRRQLFGLPLAAAMVGGGAARADTAPADTASGGIGIDQPLGIGLEGWPYPGPVGFLPLVNDGQAVRMAYMDFPPAAAANGRVVFLLHGKNFDSSYWSGPISWLRAAGFRVVVPDQIGFNKSSKPDIDYHFELLAANTMALADALSVVRITVLGHSTGGMLAVRLASIHPERVEQLVLEDPIGLIDYRAHIAPQTTATLQASEREYTATTYRAFVAHYFPILPPEHYEPFVTWRMRVALSGEYERFVRATALTYQMIYRNPVVDLYATLAPPVLLLVGEADRSAPLAGFATPERRAAMPTIPDAARGVIAAVPHGRLVTFAGVGHVPHLEVADAFQAAVLGFLTHR